MASVITVNDGSGESTSPLTVLGYETTRESQNIIHDIIGGGIAVTLIRPRPRNGTLELGYLTEEEAFEAVELHARETTFTLSDTDRPSVSMTYVVDGAISLELEDETRNAWVVSVSYQEVDE